MAQLVKANSAEDILVLNGRLVSFKMTPKNQDLIKKIINLNSSTFHNHFISLSSQLNSIHAKLLFSPIETTSYTFKYGKIVVALI